MLAISRIFAIVMLAVCCAAPGAGAYTLQGTVQSGPSPGATLLRNAQVSLYQATDGSPSLLGQAQTDASGAFTVTSSISTPTGTVLYAIARGGDQTGEGTELASVFDPSTTSSVTINELTTVATAYALAQMASNGGFRGKPLPLSVATGMAANLVAPATGTASTVIRSAPNEYQTNTWGELGTLANILAHCVRNLENACGQLYALASASNAPTPTTTTLQAMLSIAHHPAAQVRGLFTLSVRTPVFVPPFQPALDWAMNGPDAQDELMRLDAFTVAVKVNATGAVDASGNEICPFGGPGNLVFDAKGYAWIAINTIQGQAVSARCQVVLKPNGQPADGSDGRPVSPLTGGGLLGQGFGVGIDNKGQVWSGNFGWGKVYPVNASGQSLGSVSAFTLGGTALSPSVGYTGCVFRVQGIVADRLGNIWIAGWGNDTVQVFTGGDPTSKVYYPADNTCQPVGSPPPTPQFGPFDVRIDNDNTGWVSGEVTSTVSRFVLANGRLTRQFSAQLGQNGHPKGLGIDQHGNAWVAVGSANAVSVVSPAGQVLGSFAGGGVLAPWGVAVDSRNNVWVANFGSKEQKDLKYRISELCGGDAGQCAAGQVLGSPMTAPTGYTLPSGGQQVLLHSGKPLYFPLQEPSYKPLMRMTAVQVDMAGNLWCINNWKPNTLVDILAEADNTPPARGNPGGDGIVIFVGLAAPVQPVPYSAPPVAP